MRTATTVIGAVLITALSAIVIAGQAPAGGQAPGGQAPAAPAGRGAAAGGRAGGGRGAAPAEPVIPVEPHDLNGYWMLPPDIHDGRRIPDAALVPAVTRQKLAQVAAHDKDAIRYCNQVGLPAVMGLGSPYNIRISPNYMVVVTEYAPAQNRWIYLNRSTHIPADAYDPGVYGDSIGHWEGDTLLVETTMINPDKGQISIPGGGFRTADSKLVERFKLLKQGQVLQVISTWTDPKVFRTPQTYEYRYNRMARDYDGRLGSGCDPYDEERVAFVNGQAAAR